MHRERAMMVPMTPDQVRTVIFKKPAMGKRGYAEPEVDALLDRITRHLESPKTSKLTVDEVRNVVFDKPGFLKRGYDEAQVDAFIDQVVAEWPVF
jgi:DivIVA domain-containing protein